MERDLKAGCLFSWHELVNQYLLGIRFCSILNLPQGTVLFLFHHSNIMVSCCIYYGNIDIVGISYFIYLFVDLFTHSFNQQTLSAWYQAHREGVSMLSELIVIISQSTYWV